MSGFSRKIFSCPWLFASIAFFSSLEVIVLTLWAFPASIRELETAACVSNSSLFFAFRWTLILLFVFFFFLNKSALAFWNLLFSFFLSFDDVIGINIFDGNVLQLLKLLVNLVHIISLLSNVLLRGIINHFNYHHFFFIFNLLFNFNFDLLLNDWLLLLYRFFCWAFRDNLNVLSFGSLFNFSAFYELAASDSSEGVTLY